MKNVLELYDEVKIILCKCPEVLFNKYEKRFNKMTILRNDFIATSQLKQKDESYLIYIEKILRDSAFEILRNFSDKKFAKESWKFKDARSI